MKQTIRLNESQFNRLVKECVRQILNEAPMQLGANKINVTTHYTTKMPPELNGRNDMVGKFADWALYHTNTGTSNYINAPYVLHEFYVGNETSKSRYSFDKLCNEFANWLHIPYDKSIRNAAEVATIAIGKYNNWQDRRNENGYLY